MPDLIEKIDDYLTGLRALRQRVSEHTVKAYPVGLDRLFQVRAEGQLGRRRGRDPHGVRCRVDSRTAIGAAHRPPPHRLSARLFRRVRSARLRRSEPLRQYHDARAADAVSAARGVSRLDAIRLVSDARRACEAARRVGAYADFAVGVLILLSVGLRISELTRLENDRLPRPRGSAQNLRKRCPRAHSLHRRSLSTRGDGTDDFAIGRISIASADRRGVDGASLPALTFKSRAQRGAGVSQKVTPHRLRHTAATLLLEDGVDVLFLQRLLGHQNISTTALYARVAEKSLRQALERAALLSTLTQTNQRLLI